MTEQKKGTVTIRLESNLKEQLKKEASQSKLTLSKYIVHLLNNRNSKKPKQEFTPLDLALPKAGPKPKTSLKSKGLTKDNVREMVMNYRIKELEKKK